MSTKQKTVILWAFGVTLALLPLALDYQHNTFEHAASWTITIIHGELLLVSIAILADAIARAGASDDSRAIRLVLLCGSIVVLAILVFEIGELRARVASVAAGANYTANLIHKVIVDSEAGFVASMVLSFTTVAVLEE